MKKKNLLELKKSTWINVNHLNLINIRTKQPIKELYFKHIDGMYSLCETREGDTIHLRFDAEVYEIKLAT